MLAHGGTVPFSNAGDGHIHTLVPRAGAEPLTPVPPTPLRRLRDGHHAAAAHQRGGGPRRCDCGQRSSRDPARRRRGGHARVGRQFLLDTTDEPGWPKHVWLTRNQPNMPWTVAELWVPNWTLGDAARCATGGRRESESIFNRPGPHVRVHFTSDRTEWWNLYRWDGAKVDALAPMQAECGAAQWVFGLSTYAFCDDRRIALWARREGEWSSSCWMRRDR